MNIAVHHTFWWNFWNTYWPYGFGAAWLAVIGYCAIAPRKKP